MKFILCVVMIFAAFSAFAAKKVSKEELMNICKKTPWDRLCFDTGFQEWKAGRIQEADKWLAPACTHSNGAACHVLGLMYAFDKQNPEVAAKGKKYLQRSCELKYDAACKDLSKF
jgi:TPR repeat protein